MKIPSVGAIRASVLLLCAAACAQLNGPSATKEEIGYFRYVLMTLGSLDYDPACIRRSEDSLLAQIGANKQDADIIHSAAQKLHTVLQQLREAAANIRAGKTTLSAADLAALSALSDQREALIESLTNQILNTVRPETASRLRAPAKVMSTIVGGR